jgi:ketosteroid isomerase-like protein
MRPTSKGVDVFRSIVFALLLLFLCVGCKGNAPSDKAAIEQVVRECEAAVAAFNFERANSYVEPGAQWIERAYPKPADDYSGWWQLAKAAGVHLEYDVLNVDVQVEGNVAWVTLVLKALIRGDTAEARSLVGTSEAPQSEARPVFVESIVLRKLHGQWKIVLGHTSELPVDDKQG